MNLVAELSSNIPRSGRRGAGCGQRWKPPVRVSVLFSMCAVLSMGCGQASIQNTACASAGQAYLSASELPGQFDAIVSQTFSQSPVAAHRYPAGTPPPEIVDWRAGGLEGWIAAIAVGGPDRPAEDAAARSLGYRLGKWPLVPLTGAVVTHNPGVLELYQTNDYFASEQAAKAYFADLDQSAQQAETITVTEGGATKPRATPFSVSLGDQSFADETPQWMSPSLGLTEQYISIGVREGTFVIQLTVQGGSALGTAQALTLLKSALGRLAHSCQSSS